MAKKKLIKKEIASYEHTNEERLNNPPVGLVNDSTDKEYGQTKKKYEYDPHLDPQLNWTGKSEHTSFNVPTVSLHVHERIDPKSIIDSIKKQKQQGEQFSLFEQQEKPLREAVEFYKHKENWSNRLIAGDSLLVMNSLLEKEGMAEKVQMVFFDPPYGIKYGSNFQPFVNKRDVKDGKDEDLTQEPEMIKAFRDTWELGIHSYLTYLRDRLLLAKELLDKTGSLFVQISEENIHHVRELLDEVFGKENFISNIVFKTSAGRGGSYMDNIYDFIIWYAKDKKVMKYHPLFVNKQINDESSRYNKFDNGDGTYRSLTKDEKSGKVKVDISKVFCVNPLNSQGESQGETSQPFEYQGKVFYPPKGRHWSTSHKGIQKVIDSGRLYIEGKNLAYKRFLSDFPVNELKNVWMDTGSGALVHEKVYVVQTSTAVGSRCLLMTTDPGDLVLDITCGGGTTANVAEEYGRRWITCDTSRISLTLTKQRLMTNLFDYFQLARPNEGVGAGFKYNQVPHITLKDIASDEPPASEVLYDQPKIDSSKARVTGPFTVESIPSPMVKNVESELIEESEGDKSIVRSGETYRQDQWREELQLTGVRAKGGAIIEFNRIEALSGTYYIQAQGETKGDSPEKVLIVFGPEHGPLEQRTVELAIEEARYLKPDILMFCAFQFDEEAAKDIDETPENLLGFKLLKAQMNMDLQTEDLKKKRNTNQSFWLIGQPDIRLNYLSEEEVKVEVMGFDYFNPKSGNIDSGGKKNIAMWLLDIDYDGRSLFPTQVFFPMAGAKDGWAKLSKNLKAEIDENKIEAFNGTESLPFKPGKQIAVKIIDDRGIESLKILKP